MVRNRIGCNEALTVLRSEPEDENNQRNVDDGSPHRYQVQQRQGWKARKVGVKQTRRQQP